MTWSMDFMADRLGDGRPFRLLNVLDTVLRRPASDKHLSKCWHAHMEAAGFYAGGFEKLSEEEKRQ